MADLNCLLAGLVRILSPAILLIIWYKKTGARIFPAPVALGVCIPVFIFAGLIRSGFGDSATLAFYIKRGVLYGVFEEGAKFLALKLMFDYLYSCRDAVSYGIGHCAYEEFGAGISCLGLIGTGRAAPEIFWVNLWAAAEGAAFCIAVTVIIFYGIYTGRSRYTLPAAMMMHAVSNIVGHILFHTGAMIAVQTLTTAGVCVLAYFCWRKMRELEG